MLEHYQFIDCIVRRCLAKVATMRRCRSARLDVRKPVGLALRSVLAMTLCLLISPAVRAQGSPEGSASPEGRVRVSYWEKWTGMEKEAMESVIQDFNRSQSNIWVEYQSVS